MLSQRRPPPDSPPGRPSLPGLARPNLWRESILKNSTLLATTWQSNNLLGTIAFFFACYAAGTPQLDEFAHQIWRDQPDRNKIAPYDFVASLPRRMLSLPKGGALAVVGHVERAWGVSFFWGKAGAQLQVFEDCFQRLMKRNYPIGYALECSTTATPSSLDLSNEMLRSSNSLRSPTTANWRRCGRPITKPGTTSSLATRQCASPSAARQPRARSWARSSSAPPPPRTWLVLIPL